MFSAEGWQVNFKKLNLRRGALILRQPLEAGPQRGPSKQLLCLVLSQTPMCLVSCSIAFLYGGSGRLGAMGFISNSPFAVSLIVRFNVLDQNL